MLRQQKNEISVTFPNGYSRKSGENGGSLSGNVALLPVACLNFAYIPDGGVAIRDKSLRDAGQVLAMREGGRIFAVNNEDRKNIFIV